MGEGFAYFRFHSIWYGYEGNPCRGYHDGRSCRHEWDELQGRFYAHA